MRAALAALCVTALAAAGVGRAAEPAPARITISWYRTHQTVKGFGGTMGWIHPAESRREEVFDLLFKDLGVRVLRIRALGAELARERSLEEVNDNLDPFTFDWDWLPVRATEARNAATVKAARERGVETFIPTSWAPPGWMKDDGRRSGRGTLKENMLDEFAELWAAYVIGMAREFEIKVETISIQNEPDVFADGHPSCRMTPELYARAAAAVAARLKKEGLDVRLLGPDTCHANEMARYVDALDKLAVSPGTPALTHLYEQPPAFGRLSVDVLRWRAARRAAEKAERPLWFMESSNLDGSGGVSHGSFAEALVWAQKVHHALVEGNCEVVCFWHLYFDKKGQALIYAANSEAESYEITPKYFTSKNYFRFVRPGMLRVEPTCPDKALLVSAFRGPDISKRERTLVVINPTGATHPVRVFTGAPADWDRYETTATRNCERVEWKRGPALLPPRSVTTFVWTGNAARIR